MNYKLKGALIGAITFPILTRIVIEIIKYITDATLHSNLTFDFMFFGACAVVGALFGADLFKKIM